MFVRKTLTTALAAAVATTSVALLAAPAHAVYDPQPEDSLANPVAADLIGAGSDTTMLALKEAADLWNGGAKADYGQTFDIASFGAFGGGDIPLPGGDIPRPNGSSAGRNALLTNTDLDFARSSSAISGTAADQLEGVPFALDTVAMAVSSMNGAAPSNAPATLSLAQLKSIYSCTVTNWNQVGGSNAPIQALVPQAGSGTLSFFTSSLVGTTLGSCVKDYLDTNGNNVKDPGEESVQEHDVTAVNGNPFAIVPISTGRAGLVANNPVRLIQGEVAFKRAVYNLVRAADYAKPEIQAFFGPNGFLCSAEANAAITAGGLTQLATEQNGGVCGAPLDSTSDFDTNDVVTSTTTLTATNLATGVRLTATVSGASQPTGSVSFYEGSTVLKANVPLVSGQATYVVQGASVGAHTYKAVFTPNNAKYLGSERTRAHTYAKPATGPSPALVAAMAKLDKAKATLAKAKKKMKKAKGAKKAKLKKKVKKAKKAVKAANAAVAAAR